MASALVATALLLLFLGATLLTDRWRMPWRLLPLLALCGLSFALFAELTRFDHGLEQVHRTFGMIIAPLVAIFGGAAWGVRRFYGWPDLGAHPGRAALVALAILAGVLVGAGWQTQDLARTEAAVDAALAQQPAPAPQRAWMPTQLGAWSPPQVEAGVSRDGNPAVSYLVGTRTWRWRLSLAEADPTWRTARGEAPLAGPSSSGVTK